MLSSRIVVLDYVPLEHLAGACSHCAPVSVGRCRPGLEHILDIPAKQLFDRALVESHAHAENEF